MNNIYIKIIKIMEKNKLESRQKMEAEPMQMNRAELLAEHG